MTRAILLVLLSLAGCASPVRQASDAVYRSEVKTRAGSGGLRHYAGAGPAVLLLSSPGISGRIFDVPHYGGLAPYLQHKGFDVWVLDWQPLQRNANWEQAIRYVGDSLRYMSGQHPDLMVLAHGLGGVAVIASAPHLRVKRYVFLAVPGNLKSPLQPIKDFAAEKWSAPHGLADGIDLESKTGSRRNLYADLLWNYGIAPLKPAHIEPLFEPVGSAMLQDVANAIRRETWGTSFQQGLKHITQPSSVFVGQTDGIAPPWQTFATFQGIASEKKQYRFFSRANGESREYGHLSVLVGRDAANEIYPFLVDGLAFKSE